MYRRVALLVMLCATLIGAQLVHHKRGHQNLKPSVPYNIDCDDLYQQIYVLKNIRRQSTQDFPWICILQEELDGLLFVYYLRCQEA